MIALSNDVTNGATYEGKTVLLMNDLDLTGSSFNGIGPASIGVYGAGTFHGTFDGKNHTISNMTVSSNSPTDASVGLFNTLGSSAVVKNVTIKNATLNSTRYAGGIVGFVQAAENAKVTISNCEVIDSSVTSVPELLADGSYDNGDKVGGVIGYAVWVTVDNCKVENTKICGYRDLGGVVGYCHVGSVVTNNEIESVSISVDKTYNYKNYTDNTDYYANSIVGRFDLAWQNNDENCVNNTGDATITYACLIRNEADLRYIARNGVGAYDDVVLIADIDLRNEEWTPFFMGYGTFDGNGHTIKNLKVSADACPDTGDGYGAALIYWTNGNIKNLTIDGANIEGYHNAGAIVGVINSYATFGIENCHVKNATITITHKDGTLCGDKAGAIAGRIALGLSTKDCTAENCVVKGCRDVGQLFGAASASKSSGCSATNVAASVVEDSTCNDGGAGNNIGNNVIGRDLD